MPLTVNDGSRRPLRPPCQQDSVSSEVQIISCLKSRDARIRALWIQNESHGLAPLRPTVAAHAGDQLLTARLWDLSSR